MEKIWHWLGGLKLNIKFTIICLLVVTLPLTGLSIWLFRNLEDSLIEEREGAMQYKLGQAYGEVVQNVESINMSTQFFLSDQGLKDFLVAQKQGEDMDIASLMEFYQEDISALERMVNNNTALYQIRVYGQNPDMPEMMPILYRVDRMSRLDWAADASLFGWKFGYLDNLFEDYGQLSQDKQILGLITAMEAYGAGEIGILEVSMYMETMFPMLYESEETEWTCFVDAAGELYFSEAMDTQAHRQMAAWILENQGIVQETVTFFDQYGEVPVIGGVLPVKELDGILISVNAIGQELNVIRRQGFLFIGLGLLALILLTIVINQVVKGVLRQFYRIMHSIREVQKGDLDVVVPENGTDEMGELGTQINKMLTSIKELTAKNLNHELLVKDTEIRALQNQINAHFIYNVLESIKMMAEIDEKYDISDAITSLGNMLRYSMRWTSGNVTVEEELAYIKNYLQLINLRFDYEITLSLNMPEVLSRQEIPKMSLQPIVENAIYHGIEQMAEDTNIYIKGLVGVQDCVIEITDAGRGMSEEEVEILYKKINGELPGAGTSGNGIGLKNVQDRIRMSFGETYGLEISSMLGCYTKVRVKLPLALRPLEEQS